MPLPPYMIGTRNAPTQSLNTANVNSRSTTETLTRDVGLNENVTASVTFVASPTSQAQAANGTFANFKQWDQVLIEGTNENNGTFQVVAIDATNHSFLTLNPPPKSEGPVTATIRRQ